MSATTLADGEVIPMARKAGGTMKSGSGVVYTDRPRRDDGGWTHYRDLEVGDTVHGSMGAWKIETVTKRGHMEARNAADGYVSATGHNAKGAPMVLSGEPNKKVKARVTKEG